MNINRVDLVILRGLIPICLAGCTAARYNGFSFIYLLLLLVCPLLRSTRKPIEVFLGVLITVSGLFCLTHILVNISIIFHPNFLSNNSSSLTVAAGLIGVASFKNVIPSRMVRLILPDFIILFISIVLLIYFKKLKDTLCHTSKEKDKNKNKEIVQNRIMHEEECHIENETVLKNHDENLNTKKGNEEYIEMKQINKQTSYMRTTLGIDQSQNLNYWIKENLFVFFNVIMIGFAGIILPSVLHSIYFFLFLGICTFWACGKNFITKHFFHTSIFILLYSAIHINAFYLTQIEYFQQFIPDGHFLSRFLGLYCLFDATFKEKRNLAMKSQSWVRYASPVIIIYVYYICATFTRQWIEKVHTESKKTAIVRVSHSQTESLQTMNFPNLDESVPLQSTDGFKEPDHQSVESNGPRIDFSGIYNSKLSLGVRSGIADLFSHEKERPFLISVLNSIIRNSFVFTFIAMMAWSVTYQSWMSFVFLLLACYLWMRPNSRNSCLYASPFIVLYATILIIIQYIYGMYIFELSFIMNVTNKSPIELSEIGLQKWENALGPLSVMIGYLTMFWLTLRLFITEKYYKRKKYRLKNKNEEISKENSYNYLENNMGNTDNFVYKTIINILYKVCEKYWILVCCFAMLYISIQAPVVLFRIFYMVLLLYFLLVFMFSYSLWRSQMKIFWWIVIIYSMIVLLNIYLFQFKNVSYLWQNMSGLSKNNLQDIGLQHYPESSHIQDLLTPVIFLVIIIVQLRYFHDSFVKLSENNNPGTKDQDHSKYNHQCTTTFMSIKHLHSPQPFEFISSVKLIREKIRKLSNSVEPKIWLILELHFTKVVTIIIVYICILEINACNIVLIVFVVIGFPYPQFHTYFVSSSFIYCSLIILMKMTYQLNFVPEFQWSKNCSKNGLTEKFDNIKWIGLEKVEDFPTYILKWTSVLVVCMIWHIIRYRQKQFYNHCNSTKPDRGIIFPEINIDYSIDSFSDFFKFCMNFTTYKFGYEISLLTTVIVSCLRVDVYSLIYLIILFLFLFLKKRFAYRIWEQYLKVLSFLLFLQYAICVGLPPGLCIEYPFEVDIKLRRWLYLPYNRSPPVPNKILVDLIQFIFVALQYQAFQTANSKDFNSINYGTNEEDKGKPVKLTEKDFITFKNSYIDYVKHIIFYWSYWLSLAVIFTTGVFWINLFGLGYLILAFFYLWSGQNIILQKKKRLIIAWNCILVYNFLVILIKCTFQLLGCVYIKLLTDKGLCWMISLCGIQCINPMSWEIVNTGSQSESEDCKSVASGLHWDVVCFFFIIFQKKIFLSKSFLHVVLDLNVQNQFMSRGASLINEKIMTRINEQIDKENKELELIQKKINQIIKQQAHHGKPELNDHYLVIRSGDYYLFNKDSEDENYENNDTEEIDSSERRSLDYFDFMDEQNTNSSDKNNVDINASLNDTTRNPSRNSLISKNVEKGICGTSESRSSNDVDDSDNDMESDVLINPLNLLDKVIRKGPTAAVHEFRRTLSESRRSSLLVQSRLDMAPILCHNNDLGMVDNPMSTKISVSSREDLSHLSVGHSSLLTPRPFSFYVNSTIPSEDEPNESFSSYVIETDFSFATSHVLDQSDQEKMKNCCTTLKNSFIFLGCFIQSSVIQLNIYLNAWVQDYRSIRKILNKEKWLMKSAVLLRNIDEIDGRMNIEEDITHQSRHSGLPENKAERKKTKIFRQSRSPFFTFIILLSNVAFIYSEFCCYLLLIVNHMLSGNLISLLYPLFVFLWAMLSVPRPSKALWIVLITYTEIVIVIKYIFQFKYFTFNIPQSNSTQNNPLWLPSIVGIEQSNNYALLDEIQLLFIFLHRGYLKSNGLWGDHSEFYKPNQTTNGDEPPKQINCSCILTRKMYQFYYKMTNPKLNRKIDVYSLMFLCEFLALLIMILGYVSFGPGTDSGGHAIDFIKADKIPVPFIIMIITQFLFFVIDRALFLRKNVTGKFVFQIFHVLLIHAWLFFALPYITKKKFNKQLAPQILYFVKCVYFALSAYQMKSGYPWRIIGNFLTWKFNYVNLVCFKIYMGIPFLYELRNIMDWMWTDTTVAFYHWMEVEDIFSKIFVLKCWRHGELHWPTPRGKNRRLFIKYIIGGGLLLFLSICIWGPLTISSFIGNTFDKNPPVECSFSIDVGGYSPLFVFISRENNMKSVSKEKFDKMKKCYENHTISMDFLKSFEAEDVTEVRIDGESDNVWLITPPGFRKLKEKLNLKNESLKINMQAICERQTKDSKSMDRVIRFTYSRLLSVKEKDNLLLTLKTNGSLNVYLPMMFPRFLTAYKKKFSGANSLLNYKYYSPLNLTLTMKVENTTRWWEVNERIVDTGKCFAPNIPTNYSYLIVYIFSERISDHFFGNIFSNYGILGIYAAYFFVINRILRSFYVNISYIVMFEELPDVDRIYKLIREIYLVRENKKFKLEEQLIAKLIFLYRSSETLIKWTKHPQSVIANHIKTK